MSNTALKSSVNRLGFPAVLPRLIQNQRILNCYAPQSMNFSIDFGEGGRSRIEHTTRTHLPKDAKKACFAAGSYYSWLAKVFDDMVERVVNKSLTKEEKVMFQQMHERIVKMAERLIE